MSYQRGVRVTFVGHAGMYVEAGGASVLCDPWFTPAFFASWFPFPDNAGVDLEAICRPTYLYVSHLHHDHFDPEFLARHVDKEATVLLPDFPLPELKRSLEDLGFTRFVATRDGQPVDLDGIGASIFTTTTPADGPLGDSCLVISDGSVRLLDQNDARPRDLDRLVDQGPFDGHFLQFSGAIWYPMVYRFEPEEQRRLATEKRANQMSRALRYVEAVGAHHVLPCAGPAAFLDDGLFHLNDFDRDPANIFVDQAAFLDYLEARGVKGGQLLVPGSVADFGPDGECGVEHPGADAEVAAIFSDKRAYLEAYRDRRRAQIRAMLAFGPSAGMDLVGALAGWLEPLLARAPLTRQAIGSNLVIDTATAAVVIDFPAGEVRAWLGEPWDHRFHVPAALVESLVVRHVEDWVNELFLSCRFEAERQGEYEELVYSFFKCLSVERIDYLEASVKAGTVGRPRAPSGQPRPLRTRPEGEEAEALWPCEGYLVQRRCPHLGGDLARFGRVEDGVLTCTLHGWRFELSTGRCLNSEDVTLLSVADPAAQIPGRVGSSGP